MSSSNEDGTARQASTADGSDPEPVARPKGRPGRKPKGAVPAIVAELPERAPGGPGLLRHLAQRGRLAGLPGVDPPLRQGPQPGGPACRADRRHHPTAVQPPDEHPAGRVFTPHLKKILA